jgi:hypothetical protein
MAKPGTIVEFEGILSFGTIEMLLSKLRASKEFQEMQKPTKKRLYSIFVESIDNVFKYAARYPGKGLTAGKVPRVMVYREKDDFVVMVGNLVLNDDISNMRFKLDRVNQLNNEALKSLYEEVINRESTISETGAGLGLITMAMRTMEDIVYNFTTMDSEYSFFEMKIKIKG